MIKTKHWITGITIGGFILSLLLIYYIFNPELDKLFPPCPFHYITGLQCPGCGSQRALHALLHFDIAKAITQNLLFVLAIPYFGLYFYLELLGGKTKYPKIHKIIFGRKASLGLVFIIVLYSMLRNIL